MPIASCFKIMKVGIIKDQGNFTETKPISNLTLFGSFSPLT